MRKDNRLRKLNNKGSAIVTVLIVIIFISILATTVLYLAGRNVKMKATDRHTKESFYATETTLEEVKAGLVRIASDSYDKAFAEVMKHYAGSDSSSRRYLFVQTFVQSFIDTWEPEGDIYPDLTVADLVTNPAMFESVGTFDKSERNSGILYIKGVEVSHTVGGYTTKIKTDFAIRVPDAEFDVGADTSVPDSPEATRTININDCVLYVNWEKR